MNSVDCFLAQKIQVYIRGNREFTDEEYFYMDAYAVSNKNKSTRYSIYLDLRKDD